MNKKSLKILLARIKGWDNERFNRLGNRFMTLEDKLVFASHSVLFLLL